MRPLTLASSFINRLPLRPVAILEAEVTGLPEKALQRRPIRKRKVGQDVVAGEVGQSAASGLYRGVDNARSNAAWREGQWS